MKCTLVAATAFIIYAVVNPLRGDSTPLQWHTSAGLQDVWNTKVFGAQSIVDGKTYECDVYGRDFDKVPKWDADSLFPLKLDQVRKSALLAFKQRFPTFEGYEIAAIHIVHIKIVDRWVCEIEFDRTDQDGTTLSKISFLEILNGKIVSPE